MYRHSELHEAKQAEEALRRSEEGYRMLFESNAAGVVLATPGGQLVDCNTACARMFGYRSRPEFLTHTVRDLSWKPAVRVALNGDFKTKGRSSGKEIRMRRRDGTPFWVLATANRIRNLHGHAELIQTIMIGITRQRKAAAQLRRISEHLVTLQEVERRHIARELHDATAQVLVALKMNLGVIRRSGAHLGRKASRALADCFALTQECAQEIRTFSHMLHPPLLEKFGLWDALRSYLDDFKETSGLRLQLAIAGDLEQRRLPILHETALFRVAQAALMNVHLHSRSKDAAIELFQNRNQIVLQVKDNGHGLPTRVLRAVETENVDALGLGLAGMRERVKQLGGKFKVETSKRGTTITAALPCRERGKLLGATRERKRDVLKSA